MRIGRIITLITIALTGAMIGDCSDSDNPATRQLVQSAINEIPRQPNWDRIEISKDDNFSVTIYYLPSDSWPSESAVEDDTENLANAIVQKLVVTGHHPASDGTSISVWAVQPVGEGITGEKKYLTYGYTEYDPRIDGLRFKDCTGATVENPTCR